MIEKVRPQSDVLETTQYRGHPVDVLNRVQGDGHYLPEYTFTQGTEPDSTNVSLIVPHAGQMQRLPWYESPETRLNLVRSVDTVRDIATTARHHINVALNGRHPDARLLTDIVMRLGGHVNRAQNGITLRLTESVAVIDQLYTFISATPGLSQGLRVNPVYESVAMRKDVDDLVPKNQAKPSSGEECTLHVTGDGHGSPDIEIVRHLETETSRLQIVSLSRKPVHPGSAQFEMIIVLRAKKDPHILQTLPAALVSDHAGVYSAKPVAPENAQQFVQIVTPDSFDAKNLVRSQRGLQTRHRRMDGRPVVTGSVPLHHASKLQQTLGEAPFPRKLNVPLMPMPISNSPSPHTREWHQETEEGYRHGMRRLLIDLLPESAVSEQ